MKKYKLNEFKRGWLVGDFDPSIIKTEGAEFMVRYYKVGDTEPRHMHKKADEITVIISGRFVMNGQELVAGDVMHLSPGDAADFKCLEDGANAVFKAPSVREDKFLV